eukprot:gb/GECG01000291.1/.p1 GENE.gb/GECG01000291.1/~~gb/GECG01000291.1/.p1  ORF type:complete len:207 (+),score=22.52 gb/GECG01000291.1/:1-621(+)
MGDCVDKYYWLRPDTDTERSGGALNNEQADAKPNVHAGTVSQEQSSHNRPQQQQDSCVYYLATPSMMVDQETGAKAEDDGSRMQTTVYFLEREGEGLGSMHPAISRTPLFVDKETGRVTAGVPIEPDVMALNADAQTHDVPSRAHYRTPVSSIRMSSTSAMGRATNNRRGRRPSSDSDSGISFSSLDEESMVATQASSLSRRRRKS